MFPTELDNAKVLYYTPRDDYGAITYPSGEVADYSHYNKTNSIHRFGNMYILQDNDNNQLFLHLDI